MFQQDSVDVHKFAMIPNADIPRSSFRMEKAYKTTFDAGYLIPVLCEEVLPGDTFNLKMTAFCRLTTPLFPFMDNLHLDSFFFFVPNRLVWANWKRFMGEQKSPADSISFTVPQLVSPVGGYAIGSLQDYFGLPTVGQLGGAATVSHNVLPLRCYNLIWNEWFKDQNLQNWQGPASGYDGDGPDSLANYTLLKRGKRHDYFTSVLPSPQKGATATILPLGTSAPVVSNGSLISFHNAAHTRIAQLVQTTGVNTPTWSNATAAATGSVDFGVDGTSTTGLRADLSAATAATINQIRQAFQIQRLLERDARGGTRYTEIIRSHFGVVSPDARLQRPEYLGGGSTNVQINPVPQTSATSITGGATPQANLAGIGTALAHDHGFTQSFTEHGYIIGLINVRADLTYQQGLRRHWSRSTRYDYYFPVFAHLGEQAVLSKEIYCDGAAADNDVFGYQERWGEYRYLQSEITSKLRSTAASPLDPWHLAEDFATRPLLNAAFIQDPTNTTVQRVSALGAGSVGQQFIGDILFEVNAARPMPMYSVPGLIDHF